MLTYELKKAPGMPLYESLYRSIRADILSGRLAPGQKLPSKRTLCANLKVSKITVEGAYHQLLSEGYIGSKEKVGYFVEAVERTQPVSIPKPQPQPEPKPCIDLTGNGPSKFPFSVWSKLQREVMLDLGEQLLLEPPNQGLPALRQAIAEHLSQFRAMQVDPENILIGAGTDFLYNLLIQLLGSDKRYAVEEPGYGKIPMIYGAAGAQCIQVPLDDRGIRPDRLENAQVLHISPSHHFPTGIVTPLARRQALLRWANAEPDRWIIEDDYDSEFRFAAHPMPTMQSLDSRKVIYMNTFSKTLAPSIRISYMVLPPALMDRFQRELGFYSCTVPSFEQHTLARFLEEGHFEKHINRLRRAYQQRRNALVTMLRQSGLPLQILEQDAGLHFLVQVDTPWDDETLVAILARRGIKVAALSSYYHGEVPEKDRHCLVVNYSGLTQEDLGKLENMLKTWRMEH